MKQFITDPKNDILFKYIFGLDDEESKKLLKVVIEPIRMQTRTHDFVSAYRIEPYYVLFRI